MEALRDRLRRLDADVRELGSRSRATHRSHPNAAAATGGHRSAVTTHGDRQSSNPRDSRQQQHQFREPAVNSLVIAMDDSDDHDDHDRGRDGGDNHNRSRARGRREQSEPSDNREGKRSHRIHQNHKSDNRGADEVQKEEQPPSARSSSFSQQQPEQLQDSDNDRRQSKKTGRRGDLHRRAPGVDSIPEDEDVHSLLGKRRRSALADDPQIAQRVGSIENESRLTSCECVCACVCVCDSVGWLKVVECFDMCSFGNASVLVGRPRQC